MPITLPIIVPLLALTAAFGALLLHRTETMWLRPLVEALQHPRGSWIKRTVFRAASVLAKSVLYVERNVRAALSHFAAASLHLLTRWFDGLGTLAHHLFREIEGLAEDVAHSFDVLVTHKIPAMIGRVTHPIDARARAALGLAHRSISLIRELDHRLTHGIDRLRHLIERQVLARLHGIDRLLHERVLPGIRSAEHAIGRVVEHDLPAIRSRERALEREVYGDLRARIGRLEKVLGLGVFAAVVYRVLARVAPWLFCRNVKKLGNVACGLNARQMDAILAGLLGTLALSDIRTLAQYAEAVEREIAEEVRRLVSAF